jgi:oligopeptide transport system substrate-binding protein
MKKKLWIAAGLAATTTVGLVGCGGGNTSSGGSSSDNGQAANQEVTISFTAEPQGLDPSNSDASSTFTFLNMTNEGLYRLDKDGKPQPAMAADLPNVSSDGLTYTIKLKDNVKWDDGTPVKAQDFVYSWNRTADPKSTSQYEFLFEKWIQGAADFHAGKAKGMGVTAVDDKTLQVKLSTPVPFFTTQLAFPLFFPEEQTAVEKAGGNTKYGSDADKIAYNGPFKLVKWNHDQELDFVKNPNYWDAKNVKLDKVTVNVVNDANTFENLYQSAGSDVGTINSDILARWKDKPDFQQSFDASSWYLQFNEKSAAMKNAKIRQALTLAVDRKQFVNTLQPGSEPANGLVPVKILDGANNEFRQTSGNTEGDFDVAKAKQLLAEGMKEAGLTTLPKVTVIGDDTTTAKKTLEFLQGQWKQNLGVDLDVESMPNKLRIERQKNRQYDITFAGWGADYNDPMTFLDMWVTGGQFNEVGYSNPQYDKLVKQAQIETDAKNRAKELADAEKILMQDMPIGPIYYRAQMWLVRPTIKGMYFETSGPEFEFKNAYISK